MNTRARDAAFTLVFVLVGVGLCGAGVLYCLRHHAGELTLIPALAGLAVAALGIWYAIDAGKRRPATEPWGLVPRPADLDDTTKRAGHPFRGPAAPSGLSSPRTSTRATVLVVVLASIVTAAAIPFAFHLPRWIEAETVLGGWWMTWAVVLGVLSYRGRPLDRSHDLSSARSIGVLLAAPAAGPIASLARAPEAPARPRPLWLRILGGVGELLSGDVEGLAIVVAAVAVIAVATVAAWLFVDLLAPLVFFVAYLGIASALRRAIASAHRGRVWRSSLHGAAWATAYVAPLAVVVAIAHLALAR